jgi:tetratricopeptide (TPR) repeat protein
VRVSARTRIWAIVGAVAVAAAAATLGAVALTRDEPRSGAEGVEPPPLFLDLGVRTDAEAVGVRRAATLYADGELNAARAIFERFDSPDARVGAAFAAWPDTQARLASLPDERAVVRLHRGVVLAAVGDEQQARTELRAARQVEPDTPYAVRAADFLYPRFAPGLPTFVPVEEFPPRLAALSSPEQFAAVEREAGRDVASRLRYGAALQRLGRPLSAQREFEAASAADPTAETLTAAAVGRFDKERPEAAFSRLGPLAARFPRAQTVRFHLGLLLVWIGDLENARRQFTQARALGPETKLGREAKRFLDRL